MNAGRVSLTVQNRDGAAAFCRRAGRPAPRRFDDGSHSIFSAGPRSSSRVQTGRSIAAGKASSGPKVEATLSLRSAFRRQPHKAVRRFRRT